MYERILVPLDGSKLGEAVLPHVIPIARRFEAELMLLHVSKPESEFFRQLAPGILDPAAATPVSYEAAHKTYTAERTAGESYLSTLVETLVVEGVRRSAHLLEGEPATIILQFAKDAAVQLIAMSTHGRGGVTRLLMGSVSDQVMRHADLPILLRRPAHDKQSIED